MRLLPEPGNVSAPLKEEMGTSCVSVLIEAGTVAHPASHVCIGSQIGSRARHQTVSWQTELTHKFWLHPRSPENHM